MIKLSLSLSIDLSDCIGYNKINVFQRRLSDASLERESLALELLTRNLESAASHNLALRVNVRALDSFCIHSRLHGAVHASCRVYVIIQMLRRGEKQEID